MTRIALTCPNVLEGALPRRISGAARTSWAVGHAGGERECADPLSGGGWCACSVWRVLRAHDNQAGELGEERLGRIASLPGPFDELPASLRTVNTHLRHVHRSIE